MEKDAGIPAGCAGCSGRATAETLTPIVDGIARREFIARSVLMAAAAALAACAGSSDATAPTITAGSTIKVSDYPTLANVNGVAMVTLGNAPLAIVRTGTASFVALSRVCPHQGSIVNQNGTSGFLCPNHGARFSLTGTWTGGERTSSLHSYATSYDATTGILTIG